jgi:hypothetical protein
MIVHLINPLFQNGTRQWDYLITNNQGVTRERFPITVNDGDDVEAIVAATFEMVKNENWDLDEIIIDLPDGNV